MLALAAALTAALSGCGGAGGDPSGRAFLRGLQDRGLTLPSQIQLDDFHAAARRLGVTDPVDFLESMGVPVRGGGGDRWLARADLLRACGPDCNRREGLGELLAKFAVVYHRRN